MRAVVVLLLALSVTGCLGSPRVRVALLTESFAFDERAPDDAASVLELNGCPGTYDPARGALQLVRFSDTTPTFVMLVHRAETSRGPGDTRDPSAGAYWPMAAGGGGAAWLKPIEGWLNEQGSSGSWGHGSPFRTESHVTLRWDRHGATFEGEPLREGAFVNKTIVHEVTQFNASFRATQTFSATYLGKLPYSMATACGEP